jgi:hypothetical protein
MDVNDNIFEAQVRPCLEAQLLKIQNPLTEEQQKQANTWIDLLTESEESWNRRSKQRKSVRRQARFFARKAYTIGEQLFVLCSLSYSISALPKIPTGLFYDKLEQWWNSIVQPKCLKDVTKPLCQSLPENITAKKVADICLPTHSREETGQSPETPGLRDQALQVVTEISGHPSLSGHGKGWYLKCLAMPMPL